MEYELYHHGILGMKWGIRRYQNEDGSLTAAGKRRYKTKEAVSSAFSPGKDGKPSSAERIAGEVASIPEKGSKIYSSIKDLSYKKSEFDLSSMSDVDLQRAINRMNLERSYTSLKNAEKTKNKDKVNAILGVAGGVTGLAASAVTIAATIVKLTKRTKGE